MPTRRVAGELRPEAADYVKNMGALPGKVSDTEMLYRCVELGAELGIGHRVFFTGLLRGADVDRAFRLCFGTGANDVKPRCIEGQHGPMNLF